MIISIKNIINTRKQTTNNPQTVFDSSKSQKIAPVSPVISRGELPCKTSVSYIWRNWQQKKRWREWQDCRSGRNTTNSSSKKKKAEQEVRSLYNEGYYTDNIHSDSLYQELEYQDITDDEIYQKNKKKKPNKKDDWSD